jgi:uncharacterized radical SAM superfamily protein
MKNRLYNGTKRGKRQRDCRERKMRKVLHSRLIKRFCYFVCKHCHVHKLAFTAQTHEEKKLRMIHKIYSPSAHSVFLSLSVQQQQKS